MLAYRATDAEQTRHYRSDRISTINGQFFFSTREGTLEGPYFSRSDAERQVDNYIHRMVQAKELMNQKYRLDF